MPDTRVHVQVLEEEYSAALARAEVEAVALEGGSTVPGLAAKPIIDGDGVVTRREEEGRRRSQQHRSDCLRW